jgi:flavin-dependent dehydrogenase
MDVVVFDRAVFPRDKVCAGWIAPQVIADAGLDLEDYRHGRTLQPITAFRIGLIDGPGATDIDFGRPVSYGIRRREFDEYLLRRSGACLRTGDAVTSLERHHGGWRINGSLSAPMLVGAGGHFCPVARRLNPTLVDPPLVAAQEAEFEIPSHAAARFTTAPERPELYFSPDLLGYGWCFRKQRHLNIGLGRMDRRPLPAAMAAFVGFLKRRAIVPADAAFRWRGHAYLLAEPPCRRVVGPGVLLAGDAAGLAYAQSGEGIRPAIESGLLAATAISAAGGAGGEDRLAGYQLQIRARFGAGPLSRALAWIAPAGVAAACAARLLGRPWFVRRFVLDRWFLHA